MAPAAMVITRVIGMVRNAHCGRLAELRESSSGASGFMGTRLVQECSLTGCGTYRQKAPALPGVAWCPWGQLEAPEQWQDLMATADVVVHLAALVRKKPAAPSKTAGRNINWWRRWHPGSGARLQTGRRAQVCVRESDRCHRPRSSGSTKHAATRPEDNPIMDAASLQRGMLRAGCQAAKTDWCILRLPAVYGPGSPATCRVCRRWLPTEVCRCPAGAIRNTRSFASRWTT